MTGLFRGCVGALVLSAVTGCFGLPFPGLPGAGAGGGALGGSAPGTGTSGLCEAIAPASAGSPAADLVGTWQDWGGSYDLLTFDKQGTVTAATQPAGPYGGPDDTAQPILSTTGTYTVDAQKNVSVTWADGTTETNGIEVENVPGCVMLSFTRRGTRLSTEAYFERVQCPVSAATPDSGAVVDPATTTAVTR